MSNKGWFTMKDVIEDLAEVTGGRKRRLDNKYVVSGEKPPPIYISDEEDDFVQIYNGCVSKEGTTSEPDLVGIKQMLRMVNTYYDDSTYDDDENIKQLKKNANTVLSISKLNPNVAEFVPRGGSNTLKPVQEVTEKCEESKSSAIQLTTEQNDEFNMNLIQKSKDRNGILINSTNLPSKSPENGDSTHCKTLLCKYNINKTDCSHKSNINNINIDKKIDISSLNLEEIKSMRQKLKLKIIDTSKTDSLKKKRERNLAIVSLLKLHTEIPADSTNGKAVKLMTPDYFKAAPEHSLSADINNDTIQAFHDEHDMQIGESSHKVISNNDLNKTKTNEFFNKVDDVQHVSQETHKKTPAYVLSQGSFEQKGTTSSSPSIGILEMPSSVLTSDSLVSSQEDGLTSDMELPKNKNTQSNKISVDTNTKMSLNGVENIQYSSQAMYHQELESFPSSTTNSQVRNSDCTNTFDTTLEDKNFDQPMSAEIDESKRKVENWLNRLKAKKQKHKSPTLFLGPISFKRKGTTSSSQSFDTSESNMGEPATFKKQGTKTAPQDVEMSDRRNALTCNTFVPSSYADELVKSYMEQKKAMQVQHEDIWTKLERELKEKDKVIRENMLTEDHQEIQQCS